MRLERRLQALEAARQLDDNQPMEIWTVGRNPDGSEGESVLLYRWCHHTGRYLTPEAQPHKEE